MKQRIQPGDVCGCYKVLNKISIKVKGYTYYHCMCLNCGNICDIPGSQLSGHNTKRCHNCIKIERDSIIGSH